MTRPSRATALPKLDMRKAQRELAVPFNTPLESMAPELPAAGSGGLVSGGLHAPEPDERVQRGGRADVLRRSAKAGIVKHSSGKDRKKAFARGLESELHASGTALRDASERGDLELVAELASKVGTDVSASDSKQRTALHLAAARGHAAVAQLLLLSGAAKESKDCNGNSPLHLAVIAASAPTCLVLLQHGASPLSHDNSGRTPLSHAEARIRMLSARAAQVSALGGDGQAVRDRLIADIGKILDLLRVFAANTSSTAVRERATGPTDEDLRWVSNKLERFGADAGNQKDSEELQGMIADLQAILDGMKLS